MNYLSQILGLPVFDATGEKIGTVNDLGIATGEVFPRVTSLAFRGPSKTPFMISWRKYVESLDEEGIRLAVPAHEIRFSYLQPSELLLNRDLMDKQIVDTQGMKVVRVNDLKLSLSGKDQLRLLGAEVGLRGLLHTLSPQLDKITTKIAQLIGRPIPEKLIAWNYMDLLERDLSQVKLSVSHKRLDELHPADVADIIEQLDPRLRARVFAQLDTERAADTMAEMEGEYQADVIDDLPDRKASDMIASMDPDDAADLIGELSYDKAERLLKLMGIDEQRAIRKLLGYRDKTAGGIMTTEVVALDEHASAADAIEVLRNLDEDHETVYNIYTIDDTGVLKGVLSLRDIACASPEQKLHELAFNDLITIDPDEDQEEVASQIAKYDLVAMPVVDENNVLLGIVTVDDALEVMQEEHLEDLQLAGSSRGVSAEDDKPGHDLRWFLTRSTWFFIWVVLTIVVFVTQLPYGISLVLLLPVIILVAADTTSFATAQLIEADDDDEDARVKRSQQVLRHSGLGILMGALFALTLYGAGTVATAPHLPQEALLVLCISVALISALVIACTTPLIALFEYADKIERPLSSSIITPMVMTVSSLAFIGCVLAGLRMVGLI